MYWDNPLTWWNRTDVFIINYGAWALEKDKKRFIKGLIRFAKLLSTFKGLAIWREYEAAHFPTPSGEWETWCLNQTLIKEKECLPELSREQVKHRNWWRRYIPNHIMRKHGVAVLPTFRYGVAAGRQKVGPKNMTGWNTTVLDCRHDGVGDGQNVDAVYLTELADLLQQHFKPGTHVRATQELEPRREGLKEEGELL
ncbi:hypothetical protein CYMTET_23134 [Cymbomonas tetramitiformis]|uniref:Uncharacterized protein n=1 Tax=Cymbomonas tetramitiformis TaxID=36881 RepID=A0AAE0G004_9CHLO|nr:hypothetical protein CYMTET_23134 [Cymbomonas tetramitiformis]